MELGIRTALKTGVQLYDMVYGGVEYTLECLHCVKCWISNGYQPIL